MTRNEDRPAVIETLPDEVEVLVLKELGKRVLAAEKLAKATVGGGYGDGDKQTFRTPDGTMIGSVYRTDPDPEPVVTDEDALYRHLAAIPGMTETITQVMCSQEQLVEVLAERAPELLGEFTRVPEHAIRNVLAVCKAKGRPVGPDGKPLPGVEMRKPEGVLTVRPAKTAGRAIEEMQAAGLIRWDGTRALPAAGETVPPRVLAAEERRAARERLLRSSLGCGCGHFLSDHDAVDWDERGEPVNRRCRIAECDCGRVAS